MKRYVIYTRVSTGEQGKSGLDRAKGELHRASYRKLLAIGFLSDAPYTDEPRRWSLGRYGVLEDGPYISALGRMVLVRVGLRVGLAAKGA